MHADRLPLPGVRLPAPRRGRPPVPARCAPARRPGPVSGMSRPRGSFSSTEAPGRLARLPTEEDEADSRCPADRQPQRLATVAEKLSGFGEPAEERRDPPLPARRAPPLPRPPRGTGRGPGGGGGGRAPPGGGGVAGGG